MDLPQASNAANFSDLDLELGLKRKAPRAKFEVLMRKPRFQATWEFQRTDLEDPSLSTYDMALATQAATAGWSAQEIADLITEFRVKWGEPAKAERPDYMQRTIAKALESASSLTPEQEEIAKAIARMNRQHAVALASGKAVIIKEPLEDSPDPSPMFMTEKDLRTFYKNERYVVGYRQNGAPIEKSIADIWLESRERRQFEGIVFSPGVDYEDHYNLFEGFAVKPREGDCSLFWRLLAEGICAGDAELYGYTRKWLAHLVQKPGELPEVALVFRGLQGTGKSTVPTLVGKLLGRHYLEVSNMKHLVGSFNAHSGQALLIQVAEAVWGGNRADAGPLKAMVTDPTYLIERKGIDAFSVDNFKRFIFTTNEDWPVHMDADDRRFVVYDVAATFKGDQAFFEQLYVQMEEGGYEALMHDLVSVDLSDFEPRKKPQVVSGLDIKLRSANSVAQWWFDIIENGCWPPTYEEKLGPTLLHRWEQQVSKAKVFAHYKDWCQRNHERHAEKKAQFWTILKRLVTVRETRVSSGTETRQRTAVFPTRDECRDQFLDYFKTPAYQWEDQLLEDTVGTPVQVGPGGVQPSTSPEPA
jgi:hypothetical protein